MQLEIARYIIFGLVLVTALFCVTRFLWSILFSLFIVKRWDETTARVVGYYAEANEDKDSWRKVLRYTYEVNGITYTSDTLGYNLSISFGDRSQTEQYYNDYAVNQLITIKYNPSKPHKAVVEHRFDYMNILWLVFAGICIAMTYSNYTS